MQYLRGEGRGKDDFEILGDLPKKNIDTGMGIERVAFIKQGVQNMYEIDQVRPVLDLAASLSGRAYGADHGDDVRMRIVADHVRSALMLMADGVTPSNEGRGYILRRLLRRSVRAMRLLGVDAPVFGELFPASRDAMKDAYPDVAKDFPRIGRLAYAEEETFRATLASGTSILDLAVAKSKKTGATAARRRHRVPPARHVRLPDRPDARDRRRGRLVGGPCRVRHAHGAAAQQGEGGRQGQEAPTRRPVGVQRVPRPGRDHLHRLRVPQDRNHRAGHHQGRCHRRPWRVRATSPR